MLLTTLTQPSWGTSVKEATATMRTWRRFHKRTTEIGAALPDATVLMKALEEPMQLVSKTDAQAIFRLSQARAMLEVDSKPTMVAVWNFSECLLAELESLMLVSGLEAGTKEPSVSSTPAVKMMQGSTSTTACKFGDLKEDVDWVNDATLPMTGKHYQIELQDVLYARH